MTIVVHVRILDRTFEWFKLLSMEYWSALVWHYCDADPGFGSWQAMELLDHLENVLANEPVVVKKGQFIVEVKLQGITKGSVAQEVLSTLTRDGKSPDFVLCIGEDRSDEDMFESILSKPYGASSSSSSSTAEIFACTVGQKPSKARYYLDDSVDVVMLLQGLGTASESEPICSTEITPSANIEVCSLLCQHQRNKTSRYIS